MLKPTAVLLLLIVALGCDRQTHNPYTIEMTQGRRYKPQRITITQGERVIWENSSEALHTVTCDPNASMRWGVALLPAGADPFHSGDIQPGRSWSYSFWAPGTYRYFCIYHEDEMIGEVHVRPR